MERRRTERRDKLRGYGPDRRIRPDPPDKTEGRAEDRRARDRRIRDWRADSKQPEVHWEGAGRRVPPSDEHQEDPPKPA